MTVIEVSSRRGTIQVKAQITGRTPEGTVFLPFHYREVAVNLITNPATDPVARIPEYKVCAVKLRLLHPPGKKSGEIKMVDLEDLRIT